MKSSTNRPYFLFPVGEEPFQEHKLFWPGRAQVPFFTDISGQIKEPFLRFPLGLSYVFQIALTYGGPSSFTSFAPPKKGAFKIRFASFHVVDDIQPVEFIIGYFGLSKVEERTGQVKSGADLIACDPGLNLVWPTHDQGHPDATFQGGALGSVERTHVGGAGKASIIGYENDQRIVG